MIKRILLLAISMLMILSCEKKESVDFLTDGTWILERELVSTTTETLKFDSNGQYVLESAFTMHGQLNPIKGSVTGDYERQGNEIHFTSTILDLPELTLNGAGIEDETLIGQAIGSFYGYIVNGVWGSDDTLVDGIGVIDNPVLPDPEVINHERIWTILSLTNDSLKVEDNSIIKKYYKQ